MTELVWDGKYDKEGRKIAPLRVALPFQTVETVNESAQERQRTLDLFSAGRETGWRDRLIWGDKKYVLPALLQEFAGAVDLIYIDPPFATGADFSFSTSIPDSDTNFTKEPSLIEQKAYRDTWGHGLDSYLQWLYESVTLLHQLLKQTGSFYIHLDYHVAHYAKAVVDEVFGSAGFVNEIIWRRAFAHNDPGRCGSIHDNLFLYAKSESRTWNRILQKPSADYVEQFFDQYDEQRKERYARLPLDAPRHGAGGNLLYEWKGVWPAKNRTWALIREKMEALDREGRIHYPKKGMPRQKRYESEYEGAVLQDIWLDLNKIHNQSPEQLWYPTQKPEVLLDRIVRASSNEGDLVLDCFAGSGTTAAVAETLGRRWIAADLSRFAIHTTRKRLLSHSGVRPFVVQNLGKYERQLWQAAEFGDEAQARTTAYRRFVLDVFRAKPIEGYAWLHGVKEGRLVHVGTVDAPVTVGDVRHIAAEFRKAVGTGKDAPTVKAVDVLGWDFAFELNEVARQEASRAGIDVRFWRIPREILDRRAVEQGDIRFFELAALAVHVKQNGRKLNVQLTDFVIPLDDVPQEIQSGITEWSQWIDYWAIDWDNKGDTFHNEWQAYRTTKEPRLLKEAAHEYSESGEYKVVVKVIDLLGNDTTKTITVEVL